MQGEGQENIRFRLNEKTYQIKHITGASSRPETLEAAGRKLPASTCAGILSECVECMEEAKRLATINEKDVQCRICSESRASGKNPCGRKDT